VKGFTLEKRDILKMQITRWLFTPYIWGGNHALEGVDCSGFILELLRSVGLWGRVDATSAQIYEQFKPKVPVSKSPLMNFGDLVFFGKEKISHVGMVLHPDIMVEAGGGGSKTNTFEDAKKAGAFVRIRPVLSRTDFIGSLNTSDLL